MSSPKHHLNILWFSNASWFPTGYGTLTKNFTRALAAEGYGIVVAAYVGLEGSPQTDGGGIVHLPRVRARFMDDVIYAHYRFAQGHYPDKQPTNLVWSVVDIFAHDAFIWQQMPWASQTPIDCEPVLQHMRKQLAVCRWPIAVTRHAEAQMKAIGLTPLFVPWGIPTDVFQPIDRSLGRKNMLSKHLINRPISDDTFLIIVVGNNGESYRKNFSGMFEAFQIFHAEHPDSLMYVHAEPTGIHGIPLDDMVAQLGIADSVIFPAAYAMAIGLPNDGNLVDIYSAGDIKLMLSMGECPGLTDLESMSIGCPLVATNFGSSAEINITGWKVNGQMFQHLPLAYQMRPDPFEAAKCLDEAYNLWKAGGMPELRAKTMASVRDWDVKMIVKDHFIPTLDFIAEDIKRTPHKEWQKTHKLDQEKGKPIPVAWEDTSTIEVEPPTPYELQVKQAMANAKAVIDKQKTRARL